MVERQLGFLSRPQQRLAISALIEDRADRAIGKGTDLEPSSAGSLEPLCAVLAVEPQDAETGAEALLGLRPAA
jgi:hypothetical protein